MKNIKIIPKLSKILRLTKDVPQLLKKLSTSFQICQNVSKFGKYEHQKITSFAPCITKTMKCYLHVWASGIRISN